MIVNIIIMMMIYLISYFLYFDFDCKYTKYFSFYFYQYCVKLIFNRL